MKKLFAFFAAGLVAINSMAATISVWQPGGDLATSTTASNQQLAATGVSAGAYTLPNLTIDAKGRITVSTSSTSANIVSKFSGTCNGTTFLRGDGSCAVAGGGGSTPGGLNTYVQYNDGGSFGGSANFTWNNGTSTLTATNIAGSGTGLTALNASNLGSGTVPDARFPATLPALNGSALTNLNASSLASGSVADARLSGNVPLLNAQNQWTATFQQFGSATGYIRTDIANTFTFQPGSSGYAWRDNGNTANLMTLSNAAALTLNGAPPLLTLNTTTGSAPKLLFNASGTRVGFLVAPRAVNDFCNGTVSGDLCLGAAAGKIVFTVNDGSGASGTISSTGNWTIATPSSGTTMTLNNTSDNQLALNATGQFTAAYWNNNGTIKGQAYWDQTASRFVFGTLGGTSGTLRLLANGVTALDIGTTGGVQLGSPTGGDPGANALNTAGDIKINNVSVCRSDGTNCPTVIKSIGFSGVQSVSGANSVGSTYYASSGVSVAASGTCVTAICQYDLTGFTGTNVACTAVTNSNPGGVRRGSYSGSAPVSVTFQTFNTTTGTGTAYNIDVVCTGT